MDKEENTFKKDENRLKSITRNGDVITIAGTIAGSPGEEGKLAKFNGANDSGIDTADNLFLAGAQNNRIRKVLKTAQRHLYSSLNLVAN